MVSFRKSPSNPVETVRAAAWTLVAGKTYDRMLAWIGDATLVLLGEATHGSHDFYAARAALTRRLIEERGFAAVAIEADWPDAQQVNRYAQGLSAREPSDVLSGFARFPSWLWRNTAVAEFAAWLHEFNASRPEGKKAGFYGLDLYGLHASMRAVIDYLERVDPAAAVAAREDYACFDHFGDAEQYAWAARESGPACAEAVARQLVALRAHREPPHHSRRPGDAEALFNAEQNARVARDAERYYRLTLQGRTEARNLRTQHMADTLLALRAHLSAQRRQPKIVVWAHNAHVGDARATDRQGEISLGQLARERYGGEVRLIGCTTYSGHVVAASRWGGPAEVKRIEPALPGSVEDLLHQVGLPRLFLPFSSGPDVQEILGERRAERAIGVVYRPEQERWSHYFNAALADQFDAVLHVDQSHPLEPLERLSEWDPSELPETFPTGV